MCNSLTVFRRSEDVIVACFFAALPAHKEAVSLFYNKLDLFSEISLSVEQELLRNDNYLKAIDGKYRIKILEPFDIKLIFKDEESIKNYGQTVFYEGKELFFTSQETTILRNIALNYTLKSLSGLLEISVSGVNFHINNIKNKIGLNSKQEVVLFSNDIKDQIKTTRNNEICN
jgi:DNA-binding CsgD family transcriptional regulator